ncbi:MAG: hypothetical protein WCA10_01850 [Terracidiphilus sp.]
MYRLPKQRFLVEESKANVQTQLCHQDRSKHGHGFAWYGIRNWKAPIVAGYIALASCPAFAGSPQQGSAQVAPRPIVIPNRTLDPHELNDLAQRNVRRRNQDAANAARKRVIDDETGKLLILARDLKAKMESLGDGELTPTMVREAEVIEFLANDVKEKMKLTVSAD